MSRITDKDRMAWLRQNFRRIRKISERCWDIRLPDGDFVTNLSTLRKTVDAGIRWERLQGKGKI